MAISAAVEGFFRYGERWRHYRRTAELLKTEGWQFLQLTGHYRRHIAHGSAYPLFASRIEDILQQDVDAYITTVAAEPADKPPNKPDRPAPTGTRWSATGRSSAPWGAATVAGWVAGWVAGSLE